MASKLCCIAEEEEDRSESPDLPNARVNETTPAKRPLIPKDPSSNGSRFTSARTEDLHELREIFDNARDSDVHETPMNSPRTRTSRPSIYSLQSLYKVKSVHAFIKRKWSRDLSKQSHLKGLENRGDDDHSDPDTVVKVPRGGPNLQLKITKDDLRKDLLSDKDPADGGYDPDAEALDDVARNIGKKSPSKRPSLHSIDWVSSPGGKHTNVSAKCHANTEVVTKIQPYQDPLQSTSKTPIATRFTSSPNLRVGKPKTQDLKMKRSKSVIALKKPTDSHLAPICLPSIVSDDTVPWSTSMHESLRLSQFPTPPSSASLYGDKLKAESSKQCTNEIGSSRNRTWPLRAFVQESDTKSQNHVQKPPTSHHTSVSNSDDHTSSPSKENDVPNDALAMIQIGAAREETDSSRHSVHLYSMRILHHLRSGSLLSWDALADAPEMPTHPRPSSNRNLSDASRQSQLQLASRDRHERQSSSVGFASSRVPSRWGKVLHLGQARQSQDQREDDASNYSSRPQSPPESLGGSKAHLSHIQSVKSTVAKINKSELPISDRTDEEATPEATERYVGTNQESVKGPPPKESLALGPLARNNSVADMKKSKFREEFSPSPPRKKHTSATSLLKFLRSRNNVRSRSDTTLDPAKVDGAFDTPVPLHRERRTSRSMMSLQTEQAALGKDKDAVPMWERALKAHQEEKASMFLPGNKDLAVRASPFRERRVSVGRPASNKSAEDADVEPKQAAKRISLPVMHGAHQLGNPFMRRSALVQKEAASIGPDQDVPIDLHKLNDTKETVGAWGRYPSHTRNERTASAGRADDVHSRDFALEAAIDFAMGAEVDPATRADSPRLHSDKKRKKRLGVNHLTKSNSMTFGKTFMKNYTRIFRSQSTEFRRHGHGHRSSITTGGTLEYPELEIVPEVWRRGIVHEGTADRHEGHTFSAQSKDGRGKEKEREDDSQATLQLCQYSDSILHDAAKTFDGNADTETGVATAADRARVWSVYYEDCVPGFPCPSTEVALDAHKSPPRLPSRHASMHSKTLPKRFKHSRNNSHMSKVSVMSCASGVPSFLSMGEGEDQVDGRSIVSVRRSTLDLIQMYREQEVSERERVLSLVRVESKRKEETALAT